MASFQKIAQKTQGPLTQEERKELAKEFNEAAAKFGPLAETEYKQQQAIFAKLKKDIVADKQLRKLLHTNR